MWKNAWGPKQDIILAKMGGKALRTSVAGGMSGSPVYIDGKLIGAVALRISVFSPDAICGITPIELMLEINDYDESRPADAKAPDKLQARSRHRGPGRIAGPGGRRGRVPESATQTPLMVPIETPLVFSGFHDNVLREFGPDVPAAGHHRRAGRGSGSAYADPKPAADWQNALQPGDAIAGVLVSGDMSVTGLGTVTYNDGKRVLGFGHPFFNLGPVDMPMSKGEVLMVLSSQFQPNKFGNATEIVGALKQDRHSGIMGDLGATADMIPGHREGPQLRRSERGPQREGSQLQRVRASEVDAVPDDGHAVQLHLRHERIRRRSDLPAERQGRTGRPAERLAVTMLAPSEMPVPAPMLLAGWWGDKFNRLFGTP